MFLFSFSLKINAVLALLLSSFLFFCLSGQNFFQRGQNSGGGTKNRRKWQQSGNAESKRSRKINKSFKNRLFIVGKEHKLKFSVVSIPIKMPLTSAAGILALLDDPMGELKSFALRKLMSPYDPSGSTPQHPGSNPSAVIDVFWAEVSEAIATIEQLHEDSHEFRDWKLAGLVASKVYYHLGSYEDALLYALGAEDLFDVNERSEYVDTMIGKSNVCFCHSLYFTIGSIYAARCIDTYTSKRQAAEAAARRTAEGIPTDPSAAAADPKTFEVDKKMENIVDKMFQRCFDDGEFKQALGIAVETHRLDMFKAAINKSVILYYYCICIVFFILFYFASTERQECDAVVRLPSLHAADQQPPLPPGPPALPGRPLQGAGEAGLCPDVPVPHLP